MHENNTTALFCNQRFQVFQVQVQLIHGSTSARQEEIKVWLDGTDGRRRCV